MPASLALIRRSCLLVTFIVGGLAFTAQAQEPIFTFNGGADGGSPMAGVIYRDGSLYGTTLYGGSLNCPGGCGVVYKLSQHGPSWVLSRLYTFQGGADGANPWARVIFGPDGTLYGTTIYGGNGYGTVFRLQPPAHACASVSCPWIKTTLYSFESVPDGAYPSFGDLLFDQAGNIYGMTSFGGSDACQAGLGCGMVYELTPANGGWQESVLYSFHQPGNTDGAVPDAGLVFDQAGNLYGTTSYGGTFGGSECSHVTDINGCGVVFELTPTNGGWTESVLHNFTGGSDGGSPSGTLLLGPSGALYGTTQVGGEELYEGPGTVFSLAPSGGSWSLNTIQTFMGPGNPGASGELVASAGGNLFGATPATLYYHGNTDCMGALFELVPGGGGGWTYDQLSCFMNVNNQPYAPAGQVAMDGDGNIYGTAEGGGFNAGAVWEYSQE